MNQFPDIPRYDDDDVKGEQDDTIHRTDKFHTSRTRGLDLLRTTYCTTVLGFKAIDKLRELATGHRITQPSLPFSLILFT